jgi:hypothetical protein
MPVEIGLPAKCNYKAVASDFEFPDLIFLAARGAEPA